MSANRIHAASRELTRQIDECIRAHRAQFDADEIERQLWRLNEKRRAWYTAKWLCQMDKMPSGVVVHYQYGYIEALIEVNGWAAYDLIVKHGQIISSEWRS